MEGEGKTMDSTIRDVAAKAGISPSTVSRVLNQSGYVSDKTRIRVIEAMNDLQYSPSAVARSLSKSKTRMIGVIVPDICNPFFSEVFFGASQVAEKHNYRLMLCNTNEDVASEAAAIRDMLANRVCGIVITPVTEQNPLNGQILRSMQKAHKPLVFVDREISGVNCDGVFIDNVRGAYEATSLLLSCGHRKISIIAGPQNTIPGRDRMRGFSKALSEYGLLPDPRYVFTADFKSESSYDYTRTIIQIEDPPTAIFTCNNLMTLGSLKALLLYHKRIPEDIALVGFDEVDLSDTLGFNLTVVSRATTEMGRTAMRLLLNRIESPDVDHILQHVVLQPQLNVRGSEKYIQK